MVVTDNFVYIHLPKTGGTFVAHILGRIYSHSIKKKLSRLFRRNPKHQAMLKHATCSAIPTYYANLPILTTVRHPYDRYVSQYEFRWWQKYPEQFANLEDWKKECIDFPNITFKEFLFAANKLFLKFPEICKERNIGFHTEQFILYYFKRPEEIIKKINTKFIKSKEYLKDMYDIHFIHTENLNNELYDFLCSTGHRKKDIQFILNSQKINPVEGGRAASQQWENYYSDDLIDFVRKKERFLFEIFPEYNL